MQLSDKQWLAIQYLEASAVEQVLWGGAAGGGKTLTGCIWQIERRLTYPGTVGLLGRKTLIDLKKTTLKTFQRVYSEYYEHYGGRLKYNFQENIIMFPNGSIIFLADMAYNPSDTDFARFGGYELTDAFIDEVGEITEQAVNVVFSRIRYNLVNDKPAMLLSANPSNNWLKWKWVKDKQGKEVQLPEYQTYIRATLSDNPDKTFAERYTKTLSRLPETERRRLLEGDWDYIVNNDPYLSEFSYADHVREQDFNPDLPIWLSFDFNFSPTTCLMFQRHFDKLVFLKEWQVEGGTEKLCEAVIHDIGLNHVFYVTGDRSGNSRTSSVQIDNYSVMTDYNIIKKAFHVNDSAFRHNKKANARLDYSRRLCNYALKHFDISFHPSMLVTISDLQTAKVDDTGRLIKDRNQYKNDALDAFRYAINSQFPTGITDVDKVTGFASFEHFTG